MKITPDVFKAYLKCPTKCWLRAAHHPTAGSVFSEWMKAQDASYLSAERERLVAEFANGEVAFAPDTSAYWNYQREKVLVRSSERLKRIAHKVTKNSRTIIRANTVVDWPRPMACPDCGEPKIHRHSTASKTVIDLRFLRSGEKDIHAFAK